jgi:tetratricopeptide (TPR) repeat protein
MKRLGIGALSLALFLSFQSPQLVYGAQKEAIAAEEQQMFKRLVAKAVKAYKAERFEDAIVSFKAAMRLNPKFALHWNLAVLYERVEQYDQALFHVDEFLKDPELKPENRAKAQERRLKILELIVVYQHKSTPPVSPSSDSPAPPKAAEPEVVEVERVQISDPKPFVREGSLNESPTSERPWLLWALLGAGSSLSSLGMHLYANSVWENRGGLLADHQQAQRDAQTFSLIGDAFLVVGLTAFTVAILKWNSSSAPRVQSAASLELDREDYALLRAPTEYELSFTGQGFVLSGTF